MKNRLQANNNPDVVFAAGDVSLEAAGEGTPKIELLAYTGDKLALANFQYPAVINVKNVRAMDEVQLPFLRDHQQNKPVGHGQPKVEATALRHSGRLSVAGEDRDQIVAASKDGFRWQASVGGRIPDVRRNVQTIAAGERVRVNGRTFEGPLHVVNAFLWKETSIVAVGADEGRASASIAAAQSMGVTPMNEFEKWLEAAGFNSEELTDDQSKALKAAWEAQNKPVKIEASVETPVEVDVDKIVAAATTAAVEASQQQSQRDRRIDRLFASYSAVDEKQRDELRAKVEGGEISEEKAHLELLLASRGAGETSNVAIHSRGGSNSLELEAGVSRTGGLTDEQIQENLVAAGASDEQAESAVERSRQKPVGLKSVIRAVCAQEGHHVDEVDDDAIRCAMHAAQREHARSMTVEAASGGFSTVALVGILSRLANKAMLAAYAEADNGGVATKICSTTSVRDFKKFTRYRMTESGVMEQVPASGEIKHGALTEEEYENKVETYGKMLSLNRQMIRNDDLDAFLQIPRLIGRMGRHALEQNVITTLVDAPTAAGAGTTEFFHSAARGNQEPNYLAGAGTALGLTSLELAYELFLNQVDADGKPIMIDPALLLCTNGDIITARKLYTDTQYRFTTADTVEMINNQWEGMFEPVKSVYLHRLGATPSATQWYLLSNPTTDVSGVQIAFLDGNQTPTINSAETSFNTLGMQMRGYFDFGVALQDPRSIVKVEGAA